MPRAPKRDLLVHARNIWFALITLIVGYQLITYLTAGHFFLFRQRQGSFVAYAFMISTFVIVYALFQIPAIILHVMIRMRKK